MGISKGLVVEYGNISLRVIEHSTTSRGFGSPRTLELEVANSVPELGRYMAKLAEANPPKPKEPSLFEPKACFYSNLARQAAEENAKEKGVKQGLIIPLPYETIDFVANGETRQIPVSASIAEITDQHAVYLLSGDIQEVGLAAVCDDYAKLCMLPFAMFLEGKLRETKKEQRRPLVERYKKG